MLTSRPALVASLLSLAAAGCSAYTLASRPPPIAVFGDPEPQVGTVCVIRQSAFARAVTFAIHDNGQLVGATKGDSYFCYLAQPGQHSIASDTGDSVDHPGYATLAVEPGKRYWLHQDHENNFGSVTSQLAWIDEGRAAELVAGCDYKLITEAPGQLPPPVPLALARVP